MPKEVELKFDDVVSQLANQRIGNKLTIVVVSDFKTLNHPSAGKVTVPVTSTIKLEFNQCSKDFMLDFIKNINETTPIVVVQSETVQYVEPPDKIKEMIEALEKPCQNCGESKENCEKSCA